MAITVIGPSVTIGQERLADRSTDEPAIQATVIAKTVAFDSESLTTADTARPDDANPVFGQWTCRVQGPSGPAMFVIEVKADDRGNIRASVDSDLMGRHDVEEIESAGEGYIAPLHGRTMGIPGAGGAAPGPSPKRS